MVWVDVALASTIKLYASGESSGAGNNRHTNGLASTLRLVDPPAPHRIVFESVTHATR